MTPPAKTSSAEWNVAVRAYLQEACSLESAAPLKQLVSLDEDVWLVERADGATLVAKHQPFGMLTQGQAYDLLSVEQEVLALLNAAACPVPRVLGVDRATQFIFFSYCGPQTLDDVVYQQGVSARLGYLPQIIDGLKSIEAVCLDQVVDLQRLVAPALSKKELDAAWHQCGKRAHQGLAALAANAKLTTDAEARLGRWLELVLAWLGSRQPVLGCSDYRAANLVIEPTSRTLSFIEFAKIGWDWTERRLVQYTSTTGAGRRQGGFRSLLDAAAVRYAVLDLDKARALDYHYRVYWLNVAALLGQALQQPADALLVKAWSASAHRWRQLMRLLARVLADDPLAHAFSREFTA